MIQNAIERIERELKEFKSSDLKALAVKEAVSAALKDFAQQDEEFAQAIVQADKTLSDCCSEVVKGVNKSISDIEVYRRAVRFYFPGADIKVEMTIELCPSDENPGIILDLADFL